MGRTKLVMLAIACSVALTGCATDYAVKHQRGGARGVNDSLATAVKRDVIEMKRAGIGDDVVINLLRTSGSFFPMTTRDVVELADSGVTDSVINAMVLGSQMRQRGREYQSAYSYAPYYWGWGYPYWYGWDPFYGLALSAGYYWPSYGYRYGVPYGYYYPHGGAWSTRGYGGVRGGVGGGRHR
jgi:hypothetical protein